MTFTITAVPLWVSIIFFFLFPFSVYLIAQATRQATLAGGFSTQEASKKSNQVIVFYTFFLGSVALLALFGVYKVNMLPPPILLMASIPLFIFYMFVMRTNWFKDLLQNVKLESLVWIHVFRFVGVFFLINAYYGALPQHFASIGGWGDILTATGVFFVIYALKNKKSYAHKLTYFWNVFGLIDIASVLISGIIVTRLSLETGSTGVIEFATFPFAWIPAFAPATIIFLHIIVFKKMKMVKEGE